MSRLRKSQCEYASSVDNKCPRTYGIRHLQVLILFLVYLIAITVRTSIGVAIVAMTSKEYETDMFKSPNWDNVTRNWVLSSFFLGYMVLQIPSGQIAHRFGAKFLIVTALFVNAVVALLTPFAVKYGGWQLMIACRILQGLTQSCLVPSIHTLLGKWVPLEERGRLGGFVYGASGLGSATGPIISGLISPVMGWPGIFFCLGIVQFFVCGLWAYFGAESPAHHKTISYDEKQFIQTELGQNDKLLKSNLSVPWLSILKSPAFWAIVFAHIGASWDAVMLPAIVPTYMDNIMQINIKNNGLLSALPFVLMWFSTFLYSFIADFVISRNIFSVTTTRKIANTWGAWAAAAFIVAMGYVPQGNIMLFETLFCLACISKSALFVGFHVNHIDISPNFAGTLISLSNFLSNVIGAFAPTVAGLIVAADEYDILLWRRVFYVAAGFYFFSNLIYIIFGSARIADWNEPKTDKEKKLFQSLESGEKTEQLLKTKILR